MVCLDGLQCSRNNFWKLLRDPLYCGIVTIAANKTEEMQLIKGVHEPLVLEKLFYNVQLLLKSRRRQNSKREDLKHLFPLRRFLICPWCSRTLTGSISHGRGRKYRYYHCNKPKCRGRFRADTLDELYESRLKSISLVPEIYELFKLVLEDENIFTAQREYTDEREIISSDISKQQTRITKTRRLFIDGKIDENDFIDLKKEYYQMLDCLNDRLESIEHSLLSNRNDNLWQNDKLNIFQPYQNQDIAGKRHIINLLSPASINPFYPQFWAITFRWSHC